MSDQFTTSTVGQIVAADFRRAEVFERFGIDFCCNGRRLLADACRAAAIDPAEVTRALEMLPAPDVTDDDVTRWPLPQLIDHIVSVHHAFVRSSMPKISRQLSKLIDVHGTRHPEILRVDAYFNQLSADLEQHMLKEEHVLFPYVRDLVSQRGTGAMTQSPFGTVENPIRMMEREHSEAADALRIIRELTRGYSTPPDVCTTYAMTMEELRQFERDLHRHVHLENNVLFPAAVRLEQQADGSMDD